MAIKPEGQWVTFSSVLHCVECFCLLSPTQSFWSFCFPSDYAPCSFLLLSVVLKVNIRCDFRRPTQETSLNSSSNPSWAGGCPRCGSVLAGHRAGAGTGEGRAGVVQSEQLLGAQWSRHLLCLLPGLPQPHADVFAWPYPSAAGGHNPRDWLGKGQDIAGDANFNFFSGTSVSWYLPVVFSALAICSASLFSSIYCMVSQKNVTDVVDVVSRCS